MTKCETCKKEIEGEYAWAGVKNDSIVHYHKKCIPKVESKEETK